MQQHVVIMGGTSGIGLAAAEILLQMKFRVTISGRDPQRLASAGRRLRGEAGTAAVDATNQAAVAGWLSSLGTLDHLVFAFGNNRGFGPFVTIDIDNVQAGFTEKVVPQFACAQTGYKYLNPKGSITFLSSVSAVGASPGAAGIGAVNAAIASLVPTLAKELQPLRVNAVAPGVIDTPWWDWNTPEQKAALFAEFAKFTPVRRVGTAEEVGQAIAFLVTNGFMNGHTLVCDGGIRLA